MNEYIYFLIEFLKTIQLANRIGIACKVPNSCLLQFLKHRLMKKCVTYNHPRTQSDMSE